MVVQDIQEVAQYLELKFRINLQCMYARVLYYNIKPDENMNSLTLDEQLALWTPTLWTVDTHTLNSRHPHSEQ